MKKSNVYPWIVVALLWGVALLNYMDRQMLSTMKDSMQIDTQNYSLQQISVGLWLSFSGFMV